MLRRKTIPPALRPAWDAFLAQAEQVEAARAALLGCLPVGRVAPAPVPVGLDLLRDELAAVAAELPAWRVPPIETQWGRCVAAVEQSLAAVSQARKVAESTAELEELLGAVAEVVEPLDVWADAERAWRSLRVRAG